tara:strand:- start:378 stop:737 length:360 start_codon:yes stop_codon:yes gene_type:complete
MAIFSTHILNSVDGTHFSNIFIKLLKISEFDKKEIIFNKKTDHGGRLKLEFNLKKDEKCEYELQVFPPKDFYEVENVENLKKNICISCFSIRVFFHKNDATYHIPLIISPYGMSCWISR